MSGDYPEPDQSAPESARRPIEAREYCEFSHDAHSALQKLQLIGANAKSDLIVVLSALILLVSRLTGEENITLGTSDGKGLPFVMRILIDSNEPFTKLMARVQDVRKNSSLTATTISDKL